jgi:DNA replication and repair protein RecF
MSIHEVRVHGVRSYELFSADLHSGVTLVLGRNGSGKTTLIEALYFLHRGTSFRGRDRDMINHNKPRAEIKLVFSDSTERRATLSLLGATVQKEFTVNDKKSARLPTKHRLPVVLFEPDDLRLLSSSPQRRRDFFDGILARLYPSYSTLLGKYNRTLLQRNELLKQMESLPRDTWENHLFAWDVKFAELAAKIVDSRQQFVDLSNRHLSRLYSTLAGSTHTVMVEYLLQGLTLQNHQQQLFARLQDSHVSDAYKGHTSCGPHRDDISLLLDSHPASETASRGEMRTIMLAYKLLEVELQHELSQKPPLILMDDVFSELDITREKALMHALEPYQTIITATDLRDELKINASIIAL